MKVKFVLVSDLRREYSKNNAFAVNYITFNYCMEYCMERSLDFSVQTLLDMELRAKQETMEHYRATILHAEHAAEFVTYATLVDIVTQWEHSEADLKQHLTERRMIIII